MAIAPLWGSSAPVGSHPGHSRLARWAVELAGACGAAFAIGVAAVALAYLVGAESAVEDTWLGALLVIVAAVAALGSLAAFGLAVVARTRDERWAWLWLPLSVFPAVVVFIVLGEALWWE